MLDTWRFLPYLHLKALQMQVIEAHKPFEIQEIELSQWRQRPVKNNFFELVMIKEGKGMQCISYNEFRYEKGSLFLLPPLRCHSFQIEEPSKFVFLKFTSRFFHESEWFKEASYILSNYNQRPGDIIHSELDRQHILTLIDLVLKENRNYSSASNALIRSLMTSILEVLLRNIRQSSFHKVGAVDEPDERIIKMLSYINEHIAEPHLLKVDQLASTFFISPTYLSEYFRKKVNLSLREYIITARLKLVEIRLLNSPRTLAEIADELGFTDVSHLSKTFKRYTGISIREFKKQGEYRLLKRSTC